MGAIKVKTVKNFFSDLPRAFEANGYDYARFMKIFGWGSAGVWALVVTVYLIFDQSHSVGGAVVSVLASIMVSIVLFPLAVAQSSKEYNDAFALKRRPKPAPRKLKKVKRKSQQRG